MALPAVVVLGVASSAGTHHAGLEQAPGALREVGFVERLRDLGLPVEDRGDVVSEVFAVDHQHPRCRNLAAVLRVVEAVADAVARVLAEGAVPLVLGGDCTITLGVVAAAQRRRPTVGLLYFDGDADLASPATTGSGVLDAMGVAHLLGIADSGLARLGPTHPMLPDERLVLFGYDRSDPETYHEAYLRQRPGLRHFSDAAVRADPAGCARAALDGLHPKSDGVIVHFDVDAVDSGDLPLANFPHYGTGVSLDQAVRALTVACGTPHLTGMVLTEVNPTHDPGRRQLHRYVSAVTTAIAEGLHHGRR